MARLFPVRWEQGLSYFVFLVYSLVESSRLSLRRRSQTTARYPTRRLDQNSSYLTKKKEFGRKQDLGVSSSRVAVQMVKL